MKKQTRNKNSTTLLLACSKEKKNSTTLFFFFKHSLIIKKKARKICTTRISLVEKEKSAYLTLHLIEKWDPNNLEINFKVSKI
jgi:hypothetical protein